MPIRQWKVEARRMWATGVYTTKVELARLFEVSPTAMYEALDPEMGKKAAEDRATWKRTKYKENREFRENEIARASKNAKARPHKNNSTRYTERYNSDPEFREKMKAKARAQYQRTKNGRVKI